MTFCKCLYVSEYGTIGDWAFSSLFTVCGVEDGILAFSNVVSNWLFIECQLFKISCFISPFQTGPGGSGHFVKMVHNGIEYGDMQLIAEAYHLMRDVARLTNDEMSEVRVFCTSFSNSIP